MVTSEIDQREGHFFSTEVERTDILTLLPPGIKLRSFWGYSFALVLLKQLIPPGMITVESFLLTDASLRISVSSDIDKRPLEEFGLVSPESTPNLPVGGKIEFGKISISLEAA